MNIETELLDLQGRVSRIEAALKLDATQGRTPPVQTGPFAQPSPESTFSRPEAHRAPIEPSSAEGGGILGAVAVVCFVLAAVFLVQLGVSSGWLNHTRQFLILLISGIALLGGGFWAHEKDADYSGYLAATGVIVMDIAAYAGNLHFGVLDPLVTLILVGGIGLLNLYLYKRFESPIFLATGVMGVFLAPLLLGQFGQNYGFVCVYHLIWSLVFSQLSIQLKARMLSVLAAYFAFGSIGWISLSESAAASAGMLLFTQTAQFLIFAFSLVQHSLKYQSPLTAGESLAYSPVILVFYASEYSLLRQVTPDSAPWLTLGIGLLLILISASAKKRLNTRHLASSHLVNGFAALAVLHSLYWVIVPEDFRVIFLPLILLVALVRRPEPGNAGVWVTPIIAGTLMITIELLKLFLDLLKSSGPALLLIAGISAVLFLMLPILRRAKSGEESDLRYLPFALGHLLAIEFLYRVFDGLGSIWASVSWGVYALSVLGVAFARKDQQFARSSAMVLLFTTGKVFLFDVAASGSLVRILSFAVTGVILYLSGYLFRQISTLK